MVHVVGIKVEKTQTIMIESECEASKQKNLNRICAEDYEYQWDLIFNKNL